MYIINTQQTIVVSLKTMDSTEFHMLLYQTYFDEKNTVQAQALLG